MSTQSNSFVYTPTSSGTYTWRFRRVCTGATAPASSYTVDNLKVSYVIPYTRTECPETDLAYRFGFNGKEKESDIYGESNAYDFGARIYDGRIGKWLSVDPLLAKYPSMSPYIFVANSPIQAIDPDGREIYYIIRSKKNPEVVLKTYKYIGNGQFQNIKNDKLYKSGDETLSRLSNAYKKIENSNDADLKNQLTHLKNSESPHWIESGEGHNGSQTYSLGSGINKRGGIGTQQYLNFKAEDKTSKLGGGSDVGIVSHEMRHQFDYDINNMQDDLPENSSLDPTEQRGCWNENKGRKIDGKPPRDSYNGGKIPLDKLRNPPNNKQVKDIKKL